MQCTNNMKQIGLAIHQYHSAYDTFPPAGSVDVMGNSGGSGRVPQTASIHLRLTNYLEQRAVYDAYNFQLGDVLNGSSVPANTTVMSTAIPGYLCPSDPNPGSTENLAGGFSVRVTGSTTRSTAATTARTPAARQRHGLVAGRQPLFRQPGPHRGRHRRHQQHGRVQRVGEGEVGAERPRTQPGLCDRAICQRRAAERFQPLPGRQYPALGLQGRILDPPGHRPRRAVLPRHAPGPAGLRGHTGFGNVDSFIGASSFHPGGVNVLLLDGSVRFIKSSVNLSAWNALGTRAGGEVLRADAF